MPDRQEPGGADIAAGVILAVAGVLSAWATFQASLWGGNQAAAFAEANRLQTEASRLEIVATQRQATALAVAHAWLTATVDGEAARARFYERQMDSDQRRMFETWRAQLPADLGAAKTDPDQPAIPMPPLLQTGREAASRKRADAEAAFQQGEAANDIGDRFTFVTVVLSLALFLAGTGQLLRIRIARNVVIGLAGLILLGAGIYSLQIPRAPYLVSGSG
jgi:hypothetical protein